MTRYIIMANGAGTRWGTHLGTPKHLLTVNGETLLGRIVRQILSFQPSAEIIISASDPRYEVPGSRRHVPNTNEIELDRFVPELLSDNICFLYGDTYYEDSLIEEIVQSEVDEMLFWGDERSIVAIRVMDEELFRNHLNRIRDLFRRGKISQCIGWQVYRSYCGIPLETHSVSHSFQWSSKRAHGFNTPEDYRSFIELKAQTPKPDPSGPIIFCQPWSKNEI